MTAGPFWASGYDRRDPGRSDDEHPNQTMLIAIDFDKTLTADSGDPYKIGEEVPNEEMVEFVRSLKEDHHLDIIVWTARPWSHAQHVAGLLTQWGVQYNGLRMEKGGAEFYVDDRAVRPDEALDGAIHDLADV